MSPYALMWVVAGLVALSAVVVSVCRIWHVAFPPQEMGTHPPRHPDQTAAATHHPSTTRPRVNVGHVDAIMEAIAADVPDAAVAYRIATHAAMASIDWLNAHPTDGAA